MTVPPYGLAIPSNHRRIIGEVYGTVSGGKRLVDAPSVVADVIFGSGLSLMLLVGKAACPPRIHLPPVPEICQSAFF